MGDVGRDFQRDHAVGAVGFFVHGLHQVAGAADVFDGKGIEGVAYATGVVLQPVLQGAVIGITSEGFLEDSGV